MPRPRIAINKRPEHETVIVPKPTPKRFYGKGLPQIDLKELAGKLIVVEGADGSGRSTQINRCVEWLEASGHATVQVGLKRSTLVSNELKSWPRPTTSWRGSDPSWHR